MSLQGGAVIPVWQMYTGKCLRVFIVRNFCVFQTMCHFFVPWHQQQMFPGVQQLVQVTTTMLLEASHIPGIQMDKHG